MIRLVVCWRVREGAWVKDFVVFLHHLPPLPTNRKQSVHFVHPRDPDW